MNIQASENGVVVRLGSENNGQGADDTSAPFRDDRILQKSNEDAGSISSLLRRLSRPAENSKPIQSGPVVTATSPTASLPSSEPLSLEIECRRCSDVGAEASARAFVMGPNPLSIVLCSNRLHELSGNVRSQAAADEIEETIVHELIHVHDVKTVGLDLTNCDQLAYSEVRAAREAECRSFSWAMPQAYCVRQKARTATSNMFPMEGRECVERVLQRALADRRPFVTNTSNESHGKGASTSANAAGKRPIQKTEGEGRHFTPYPSDR
jgi:hypothetical protein